MASDRRKQLVRDYYERVVSSGDLARLEDFISDDYVEVHDNVRHEIGLEGARAHIVGARATYPDLKLSVEQQIAEGEWIVSRVTARGTHQGDWMGMKATGKVVVATVVNIDRVRDGRIIEHGGAANLLEPLLQAGAVKVVGN